MEEKIISGIVYVALDDEIGPNPLVWSADLSTENLMHVSIKTITVLSGERGLVPESLVILPFPSLDSKALIKYIKWDDPSRRGGIGQSALALLFKEGDDVIFYKYLDQFTDPFNEYAEYIIELEKTRAPKEDFSGIIDRFEFDTNYLLNELRVKETTESETKEFPDEKYKELGLIDYKFKIAIIGDPGAGKTSLVLRFTDNAFRRTYIPTLGVHVSDKIFKINDSVIQLVLWDIAGQKKFDTLRHQFYMGSDAVFIIFDLTNPKSFESVPNWFTDVQRQLKNRTLNGFIAGNKMDLNERRNIGTEDASNLANSFNLGYIETSALSGENVERAFLSIAEKLYKSLL